LSLVQTNFGWYLHIELTSVQKIDDEGYFHA